MNKVLMLVMCSLLVSISLSSAQDQQSSTNTPVVRERQTNQQKRIGQGVKSGQLTPKETRRLERQQAKIQHDKKMAKADGTVTPRERAKLKREQNRASRRIYRLKHNAKTTEPVK
jgi:hypothetical protein